MKKIILIKKKQRAPSLRARSAVNELVANGRISKAQALRKAGYSEAVARHPNRVFNSEPVKELMDPILEGYKKVQKKIVDAMVAMPDKRIRKTGILSLSMAAKNVTFDTQLLSGAPTDRSHVLTEEEQKEVEGAFGIHTK